MWKAIVQFELDYRKQRASSYVYFLLLFLSALWLTSLKTVNLESIGIHVKVGQTYNLLHFSAIPMLLAVFLASRINGLAVLRDFEHRAQTLFFANTVPKFDYLFGRFVGSLLVFLCLLLAIPLGFLAGNALFDRATGVSFPILLLESLLLLILPNAFILAGISFSFGAFSRQRRVIFAQAIILLGLYLWASHTQYLMMATLLDPFGIQPLFSLQSVGYPIGDVFTMPPIDFLYNRLWWFGITSALLWATYKRLSIEPLFEERVSASQEHLRVTRRPIPKVELQTNAYVQRTWELAKMYYLNVINDRAFLGLSIIGFVVIIFRGITATHSPTTNYILDSMGLLTDFIAPLLMIFYVGNLVWLERDLGMEAFYDALPLPAVIRPLSKFLGLIFAFFCLYVTAMVVGLLVQMTYDVRYLNLSLYFSTLFGSNFMLLVTIAVLGFSVHYFIKSKWVGTGILAVIVVIGKWLLFL